MIDPADAMRRRLREAIDRALLGPAVLTSTTAAEGPPLDPARMLRDAAAAMREYRRTNLTLVVQAGHAGGMIYSSHPTDGTFVECSHAQAAQVHALVPLRLVRVVSEDCAHFEVVPRIPGITWPAVLPAPPYQLPDNQENHP